MGKAAWRLVIVWIGAGITIAGLAYAQPQPLGVAPRGIIVKKLPPGTTQQQLQQRLAPALARMTANSQLRIQQSQREAKAITDATANERAAVNAALAKDPRYKAFIEQVQKISAGPGTNEAKAQQLRALAKGNQAIFADALKAAKIDHNALQSKLRAVVPGITLTPNFSVRKGIIPRGSLVVPSGTTPTTKEVVLRPPFSFEEFEADNQGIAASDAVANSNSDDGKATSRVTVVGVAGSGNARATFGEFVNVPAGVKRIEFTVAHKMSYSGYAVGAVAGSSADAFVTICVQNEAADQSKCEVLFDYVMAAVAWYAEMEGGRSGDFRVSFNVPASGGNYLVSGSSESFAGGIGIPASAEGRARSEIDKITVKFFYE